MTGMTMRKVLCSCVLLLFLWHSHLWGQSIIQVEGTVIAAEDQLPIIGVTVAVKGANQGTVTDFNGAFSLPVPSDAVLVFSFVGYVMQEVAVGGRTKIDIILQSDYKVLEDVIVVGYRREIKSNVSSSISSIKAESINHLPLVGLDQAIQGQAPGIQITQ